LRISAHILYSLLRPQATAVDVITGEAAEHVTSYNTGPRDKVRHVISISII